MYNSNLTFLFLFFLYFLHIIQMHSKRKTGIFNIYHQVNLAIIFRQPGNSLRGEVLGKKKKKVKFGKTQFCPYFLLFLCALCLLHCFIFGWQHNFGSTVFFLATAQWAFWHLLVTTKPHFGSAEGCFWEQPSSTSTSSSLPLRQQYPPWALLHASQLLQPGLHWEGMR